MTRGASLPAAGLGLGGQFTCLQPVQGATGSQNALGATGIVALVEEMSYKELSKVFRVPGPVLKMRMHRALLRLNKLVEEELQ